jgi:hypothetical protein
MDLDESKLNSPHHDCNAVGRHEDKPCGWTDQQTNVQLVRERTVRTKRFNFVKQQKSTLQFGVNTVLNCILHPSLESVYSFLT